MEEVNAKRAHERFLRGSMDMSADKTLQLTEASIASASADLSTLRLGVYDLDYNDSQITSRRSSITSVGSFEPSSSAAGHGIKKDDSMDDNSSVFSDNSTNGSPSPKIRNSKFNDSASYKTKML